MNTLVPNRLLFRYEFPLAYRKEPPAIDGSTTGWTAAERLPSLGLLEGHEDFADVWCCWNERGLTIATSVEKRRSALQCDFREFWKGDNLRLMLDLRDTRQIKRATRYCFHLFFLPTGGLDGAPIAGSHPVKRAKEASPEITPGSIEIAANVRQDGYSLSAHVPAAVLPGFDPEQFQRIGFFTMLEDRDHGRQSLTVSDEWPWHMDPSLWATAVLSR